MTTSQLRFCPECGGPWPRGPEFALRGAGWLKGLPRGSSLVNIDGLLHDGAQGRNRFLVLEFKGRDEPWPSKGQARSLAAMASLDRFTVRVLRGSTRRIAIHRVTGRGIDLEPTVTTYAEAIRSGIGDWLEGGEWRDIERVFGEPQVDAGHVCGWARVNGVWTCVQDAFAVGFDPDTACGAVMLDVG